MTFRTIEERNADIMKAMEEYAAAHDTPEKALAGLVKMGIYTAEGKLRPEFGGDLDEVTSEA